VTGGAFPDTTTTYRSPAAQPPAPSHHDRGQRTWSKAPGSLRHGLFLRRSAFAAPSDQTWLARNTTQAQSDDEEEQVQERMLGKLTYVGIGRGRVVRNKRREARRYDREIDLGLAEYQEDRTKVATTA
jgi:hypothetical protein